ncbi:MAG TPA: exodeoxyribonuclease VII small subunit [Chloroflexota bacterium]|nr:exodeoxyribonuclease VII small subunit [Chloroflexota bacterium]
MNASTNGETPGRGGAHLEAAPLGDAIPFGEAMEQLEAIISRLEGDEALELETALALYEQGAELAASLRRRLAAAQLKLTEIAASVPAPDVPPSPDTPPDSDEGPATP